MQNNKPKKKKPAPSIPLMELLAFNSIGPARKLLQKYGKEDAIDEKDLQDKLTDLYAGAKDKIEIEKDFASIHPHKDFILKYLSPPVVTKVLLPEPTSGCEGNPNCACNKTSSVEGVEPIKPKLNEQLIACVSMVAIVGLVIYATKK